MVKGKPVRDFGQQKQRNLWEFTPVDPGPAVKMAMREVVRGSSLSREQIVDEMNRLATAAGITCNGRSQQVTPALLDKWLAPAAQQHIIPLRLLPIFCRAAGSNLPLQALAAACAGVRVIGEDDYLILEWARAEIAGKRARKLARRLAQEVGIE